MTKLVHMAFVGLFTMFAWLAPAHAGNPIEDFLRSLEGVLEGSINGGGYNSHNRNADLHLGIFASRFNPNGVAINDLRNVLFEPESKQHVDYSWRASVGGYDTWGEMRVTKTTRGTDGVCRSFNVRVNWIDVRYNNGRVDRNRHNRTVYGEACLVENINGYQHWHIGNRYWD